MMQKQLSFLIISLKKLIIVSRPDPIHSILQILVLLLVSCTPQVASIADYLRKVIAVVV